jgi:carboxylesterase
MTRGRKALVAILALILAALLWLLLPPRWTPPPVSARPALNRDDALERLRRLEARDDSVPLYPPCRTLVLDHGAKTPRAYVLLHGFTNCPRQFGALARLLYDDGANVLVPRMPRHGLANAPTSVLSDLTTVELVATSGEAVDIARGLGDRVSVIGLSSGAVVAAWLAQHRADLDQVLLIAPCFAPKDVSEGLAVPLSNALLRIPDVFVPWDPEHKQPYGPKSAYAGFSTHALARVYELGAHVLNTKPPTRGTRVLLVTTPHDEGVNNEIARELERRWLEQGADVRSFEFPAEAWVHHDMIDPEQPYQRLAVVYPLLRTFLATEQAPTLADSAAYGGDSTRAAAKAADQAGATPP